MGDAETAQAAEEQPEVDYDLERAERFYTRLRGRIARWLRRRGKAADRVGGYLLLLPDFLALIIRLIRDPRVERSAKFQLIAVTTYIVSPLDLIPDFLLPFGLIDDTVAAALVLSQIVSLMEGAGDEILREHWEGEGDVLDKIQKVTRAADNLLGGRVLKGLRRRFKGQGRD